MYPVASFTKNVFALKIKSPSCFYFLKFFSAQINPHMPRTFGDAQIHISHFDYAVNVDTPLPDHGGKPPSPEEVQIGKHIAQNLVEDGATLQMGWYNHLCESFILFGSINTKILIVFKVLATFLTLFSVSWETTKILEFTLRCSVVDLSI